MEDDITKPFHDHLDKCKQCRENPFALCEVGALLIQITAGRAILELDRIKKETP